MVPDRYHSKAHETPVVSGNSIDRIEHDVLRQLIAEWRAKAGLSQRELSAKLQHPHNYIVKIETGVRAVMVVDLVDIMRALGKDVGSGFAEYGARIGGSH